MSPSTSLGASTMGPTPSEGGYPSASRPVPGQAGGGAGRGSFWVEAVGGVTPEGQG